MTNIYVGNLDFAATEDQLRTLFRAYGAVETVTVVTDRDTGQPRGLAFVEMTTDGEAQDAIRALNGSVHGGRALIVNEARPQAPPHSRTRVIYESGSQATSSLIIDETMSLFCSGSRTIPEHRRTRGGKRQWVSTR